VGCAKSFVDEPAEAVSTLKLLGFRGTDARLYDRRTLAELEPS
jgi:hypothetical protein